MVALGDVVIRFMGIDVLAGKGGVNWIGADGW